ncbi:MAG TPA: histidine kinase dimerization/phospho-acceptor domain-containing protein, partial [Saprospiraceae bacterium]|nr:histidine kinase dimerization/phospho-acceptor domain-containing protein [Saprospiraceae bacterium]
SESLLDKVSSTAAKEDLEMIISSGRRLSNLVNDILDFSRLKERDLTLHQKPVDLRALVTHCLRMNKHTLGDKSLVLVNKIDDQLPVLLCR